MAIIIKNQTFSQILDNYEKFGPTDRKHSKFINKKKAAYGSQPVSLKRAGISSPSVMP